jgi:aspartyl aminopeptidase
MLCRNAGVPVQKYVNHSDVLGGSTLGSISSGQLDMKSVDVGNPMLAMHSIRELSGVEDHFYMLKVFEEFFK